MPTVSTMDVLKQQRQVCLRRLRAISPEAARLVTELESLDIAVMNIQSSVHSTEYAGFRNAIDAIVECLKKNARVMTIDELGLQITEGGWLSADERAFFNVRDSVDYHVRRQGKSSHIIRSVPEATAKYQPGLLVGLYDWPDEKFQPLNF